MWDISPTLPSLVETMKKSLSNDVYVVFTMLKKWIDDVVLTSNHNKYIAGIAMILFNIGSRHLVLDISKSTDNLLKNKIMRRITLFSIFFLGTRDIYAAFVLTATFLVITMNLFNEESEYCILPSKMRDNVFTPEEYEYSKRIISNYERINNIKKEEQYCVASND